MTSSKLGKPWLAVAQAYGDGRLTVYEICERYGVSVPALYARARREGWPPRRTSMARWQPAGERGDSGPAGASDEPAAAPGEAMAAAPAALAQTGDRCGDPANDCSIAGSRSGARLRPRSGPRTGPEYRRQRRRNFIRRLYDAMETKLTMIEERLEAARSLPPSERGNAADTEREIRAFDAMARSFDRVATLDETHNEPDQRPGGNAAKPAARSGRSDATAAGRAGDDASDDDELDLWREQLAARIRRLRSEWSA